MEHGTSVNRRNKFLSLSYRHELTRFMFHLQMVADYSGRWNEKVNRMKGRSDVWKIDTSRKEINQVNVPLKSQKLINISEYFMEHLHTISFLFFAFKWKFESSRNFTNFPLPSSRFKKIFVISCDDRLELLFSQVNYLEDCCWKLGSSKDTSGLSFGPLSRLLCLFDSESSYFSSWVGFKKDSLSPSMPSSFEFRWSCRFVDANGKLSALRTLRHNFDVEPCRRKNSWKINHRPCHGNDFSRPIISSVSVFLSFQETPRETLIYD